MLDFLSSAHRSSRDSCSAIQLQPATGVTGNGSCFTCKGEGWAVTDFGDGVAEGRGEGGKEGRGKWFVACHYPW